MTDINAQALNHLDLLLIQGPDAVKFLQGQCTQDVAQLPTSSAVHGAFCNAKGRAITNVWLVNIPDSDAIALLCHKSSAPLLFKHLSKYVAFFRGTKLSYQAEQYRAMGAINDESEVSAALSFNETQQFIVSWGDRLMLWQPTNSETDASSVLHQLNATPMSQQQWQLADIKENKLWLNAAQVERWIPQNFSLDALDGISFTKGCYTGQEVIARLHYKGQSKKRLFAFSCSAATEADLKQIYAQGKAIGDVIEQITIDGLRYGFAVLKADQTSEPMFADENQQVNIELLH